MNNLEFSKNILFKNVKGSFLTIVDRRLSDASPFDFISKLRISSYFHYIIKNNEKNSYYFPDILSDIRITDGDNQEFKFITLDENINNSSYFILESELKKLKIKRSDNDLEETIKYVIETITNIYTNQGLALLYSKDNLFDGFANFKMKYFHDFLLPIYLIKIGGTKIDEITLLNDQEDILNSIGAMDIFKNTLENYI
jgi:hypothetical protein